MKPRKKPRGRTTISKISPVSPTRRHTTNEHFTQVARAVSAGAGPRRGDRRDMHKTFTGTKRHAARGNAQRVGRKTRKR